MKPKHIVYILINYIILMSITIIAVIKRQEFLDYITIISSTAIILNIVIFLIYIIYSNLKVEEDTNTFEMIIDSDAEEIKDLLKEADTGQIQEEISYDQTDKDLNEKNDIENDFKEE